MKILHVIDGLELGGAEILLRNTLRQFKADTHIVCYLGGEAPLKQDLKDYELQSLYYNSIFDLIPTIFRLKKIISRSKPDLLHAHLFLSTLIARLACPSSVKFLFTIHNLLSKDAFEVNKISLYVEKITYKKRHHVIGVSKEVIKDYDINVGVKGSYSVLYNYVDDKYFSISRKRSCENSDLKFIAVGNLRRQKNYANLIQAFYYLKNYPITLDIYGSGPLDDSLSQLINDLDVSVTLKGRVNDLSLVLPDYDALIMPSLFEGFGIAPMEAMASGMPVLLSDIPVFREIAGDLPVYFNPLNPISIADSIKASFDNRALLNQQIPHNIMIAREKASSDVYFKSLNSIYTRQLLS